MRPSAYFSTFLTAFSAFKTLGGTDIDIDIDIDIEAEPLAVLFNSGCFLMYSAIHVKNPLEISPSSASALKFFLGPNPKKEPPSLNFSSRNV